MRKLTQNYDVYSVRYFISVPHDTQHPYSTSDQPQKVGSPMVCKFIFFYSCIFLYENASKHSNALIKPSILSQ